MASLIKQYIFRLQVTVEDVVLVQVLEGKEYVGGIELGCFLSEPAYMLYIEEQLASRAVVQYKKEVAFTLKGVLHFHNHRVINAL